LPSWFQDGLWWFWFSKWRLHLFSSLRAKLVHKSEVPKLFGTALRYLALPASIIWDTPCRQERWLRQWRSSSIAARRREGKSWSRRTEAWCRQVHIPALSAIQTYPLAWWTVRAWSRDRKDACDYRLAGVVHPPARALCIRHAPPGRSV
jgi:hypothetical protein